MVESLKIKRFVYLVLCISYVFAFFSILFFPVRATYALTAANFALNPGTDANAVNEAYKYTSQLGTLTGNEYFTNTALNNITILVKDFPGLGSVNLGYNSTLSDDFGRDKQAGTDALPGAGELFFTNTYYCNATNGNISKTPISNGNQYVVEYAVGLYKSPGEFASRDNYTIAAGPTKVTRQFAVSSGQSDQVAFDIKTTKDPDHEINPDQLNDGIGTLTSAGMPASCLPASIVGEGISIKNYNKLTGATKTAFEAVAAIAPTNGGGNAAGGEADNCEASDSGALGWILCPIIALGSTFTTYVFENFIVPFFEDVPVTTDPKDGSYIAWKQFRLIGNIVLVGAMLAVVYAQVKN